MEESQTIPVQETERALKLQEVILKAMAKKLTWIQAAEIAGMSVRNMQRMRQRYQEGGYTGLFDQRRRKRSMHRIPMEMAEFPCEAAAVFVRQLRGPHLSTWP